MSDRTKRILGRTYPQAVVCLLLLLFYFPTFSGDFILDDRPLIKNNVYLKQGHSLLSYLHQEDGVPEGSGSRGLHTGYYRPLINLTYWMDYRLWGMQAGGFRLTSLVLHFLTCMILHHLIILLGGGRQAAFWVTLAFALHPVNTESVAWITSRNNILVALFGLASLYCYVRGWEKGSVGWWGLSILLFAGALLSKEFGLLLLPIFFLYQRLLSSRPGSLLREIMSYLPHGLILLGYLVLRAHVMGGIVPLSEAGPLGVRLYFAPYLVVLNLALIFLPFRLHSFIIGYPPGYAGWQAIAGFVFLALFGFFIWRERRTRLACFSLLSFLAALFPVLNIIPISSASLISMRWLYFPATFLFIGLSAYLRKLLAINRFLTVSTLCLMILYSGWYTLILNTNLWHHEETFFVQEVRHFHNGYYAAGLAEILQERGDRQGAEALFQEAIEGGRAGAREFINYAGLLLDTGRAEQALASLKRAEALPMNPREIGEYHNNMGMACFMAGMQEEAIRHFRKAVLFFPGDSRSWSNLGSAYGSWGQYEKSVAAFEKGLKIAPQSIGLKKNLAVTHMKMAAYGRALALLEDIPLAEREGDGDILRLIKEAREKVGTADTLPDAVEGRPPD